MGIIRKRLILTLIFPLVLNINSANSQELEGNKKVRFIAVGDTGTGSKSQYDVAKAMKEKCDKSGCDFVILLGDNIYNSGVKSIYDSQFKTKFEDPYKDLNLKFYLTLGNHDYRGNVQAQVDYSKISKKWVMPARTYNFSHEFVDFFSIDTNDPSDKQRERLSRDIKRSTGKWQIVFGHHPRYTNGVYGNATGKLAALIDKPLCNQAELYLSGHEHTKQHLKSVCGIEHLVIGTGAGLRKAGVGKNTLFAKSSLGFAWFELKENNMYFEILDTKGNVEYKYNLKK